MNTNPSTEIPLISLMSPHVPPTGHRQGGTMPAWATDLRLEDLARALNSDPRYVTFIRQTLGTLNTDVEIVAWRQAILDDFTRNPALLERVEALLPRLADLHMDKGTLGKLRRSSLFEAVDRLAELEVYLDIVQELHDMLAETDLHSQGLISLRDGLLAMTQEEMFVSLRAELPELRKPLQNLASMTIGINLNSQLQPVSAVIVSINEFKFIDSKSLLEKLLRGEMEGETGVAPLHFTPQEPEMRPLSPFFRDLEKLIEQASQPITRALKRYVRVNSAPITGLEQEFAFYIAAVKLRQRLESQGVTLCTPVIATTEERITDIKGLVNIYLPLRGITPVPSDLTFDGNGRIAILTGPNSGGKTTYLQAAGLAFVLFQAGLFIPAREARLSPADAMFTHFPALEAQQGRLAEEAERLKNICIHTTDRSVVLLNESLTSTAFGEALYLAHDILAALRAIGVRAIYATHLIELVDKMKDVESSIDGDSNLYSLVAGIRLTNDLDQPEAIPTFEVSRGMPLGRSYAQEIARRHGIGLDQLLASRANKPS